MEERTDDQPLNLRPILTRVDGQQLDTRRFGEKLVECFVIDVRKIVEGGGLARAASGSSAQTAAIFLSKRNMMRHSRYTAHVFPTALSCLAPL